MKLISLLLLPFLFCCSCGDSGSSDDDDDNNNNDDLATPLNPSFEAIEISDLSLKLTDGYVMAMEQISMTVGYVELTTDQTSGRPQSSFDEVFFVFAGSGIITIGSTEQPVVKGDAIIARGALETKVSTDGDIQVVVVTMKENSFVRGNGFEHYKKSRITSSKSASGNAWNPFLQESNVLFGLYSLPQSLGGDQALTHTWEELNIIASGSSQFSVGNQSINVKSGSIVFVQSGSGHFFSQLSADIDIMILWEQ